MAVVQLEAGDAHQPENGFVAPEPAASPAGQLARVDSAVLPFLGGFGRYQKQLIVLTWIPALFIGFSQYSDSVLLAQPNSTCTQPNTSDHHHHQSWLSGGPHQYHRPHDAGENSSSPDDWMNTQCVPNCTEWSFVQHTGLHQNVVTKVQMSRGCCVHAPGHPTPLCSF